MLPMFSGGGAGGAPAKADGKDEVVSANIWPFKDQIELDALVRFHENYYAYGHRSQIVGKSLNHIVFRVEDGAKTFQAADEIVVDRAKLEKHAVSIAVQDRLENLIAFNLIKQVEFTDQISIFIPVNHIQEHWTALVVDFKLDATTKAYFKAMQQKFNAEQSKLRSSSTELDYITQINPAKNFVQAYLKEEGHIPFESTVLSHQDSINSEGYHGPVEQSASVYLEQHAATFERVKSPQQAGNTCAEHTAANGIAWGLYGQRLTEFDSTEARRLTNLMTAMARGKDLAKEVLASFVKVNAALVEPQPASTARPKR